MPEQVAQGQTQELFPDFENELETLRCRQYPQVIKYMGSKAKIVEFIAQGLDRVYSGDSVCDLFAGACSLSGAIGHSTRIISNDIQGYSSAIANVYLRPVSTIDTDEILAEANRLVSRRYSRLPSGLDYSSNMSLEEFQEVEKRNQELIDRKFSYSHHLFVKNYSGTWWSAIQCLWIDSIKEVVDKKFENKELSESEFYFVLTCLMHAMAYCSQGTGHYAQFRDAKTTSSMNDIGKYRKNTIQNYFRRKMNSLSEWNRSNVRDLDHEIWNYDYKDCLARLRQCTVYADPPYAFVHYSRFYHAIETLYHYDYPDLQVKGGQIVKGRYRENRHQSPFCIRTQVKSAFQALFDGVKASNSNLVLSYSNTGMIDIDELIELSHHSFGKDYEVWVENLNHTHMTMGRREDRDREVEESIVLAQYMG